MTARTAHALSPATRRPASHHTSWTAFLWALVQLPLYDLWLHALAAVTATGKWLHRHLPNDLSVESHAFYWCGTCHLPHKLTESCNRELIRFCMDCNDWRSADQHMRCPIDARHSVHAEMRRDEFWQPLQTHQPSIYRRLH